jgi:hypothetical protein
MAKRPVVHDLTPPAVCRVGLLKRVTTRWPTRHCAVPILGSYENRFPNP